MSPPRTLILQKIRVLSFIFSWSLLTSLPLISLRVLSEPWKNFDGSWITWILELQPKFLRTSTRSHSQSKGSCLAHALLKRPLIKLNNFYLPCLWILRCLPWSHAYIIPVKLWSVSFVFLSSQHLQSHESAICHVLLYHHPTLYKN